MTDFWKGTVGGEVANGGGVIANPMEAALVRKLKIRLLPFLFLLFVLHTTGWMLTCQRAIAHLSPL
jgi:hypothetical protein